MSLFIVSVKSGASCIVKPTAFHIPREEDVDTFYDLFNKVKKSKFIKAKQNTFFAHLSKRLKVGICYHLLSVIM